jgi:CheY-like chemotaxis protein
MRARPILLVEDDPDARDMVRFFLEENGCRVTTAPDGLAALESVSRTRPALILLDLAMPRMDGQTFARLLREAPDPGLAATPIALMSALRNLDEIANEIGATAIVQKPIDLDALLDVVRIHCGCDDDAEEEPLPLGLAIRES